MFVALFASIAVNCRDDVLGGVRGVKGHCPYQRPSVNCAQGFFFAEHETECFEDEDCGESLKCCQRGCDMECVASVHYHRWCKAPVDLAILFDTEATVWPAVKKMINDVILHMSISEVATHVSLRTIAKHSELLLKFNQLSGRKMNGVNVWSTIKKIAPQKSSGKLSTALKFAKDMFSEANGGRPNAIKVLLVITDGNVAEDESSTVGSAAQALRDAGILVQTVGITMEMSLFNLVSIATSDIYVWPGVDAEMLGNLKKLQKEPCNWEVTSKRKI